MPAVSVYVVALRRLFAALLLLIFAAAPILHGQYHWLLIVGLMFSGGAATMTTPISPLSSVNICLAAIDTRHIFLSRHFPSGRLISWRSRSIPSYAIFIVIFPLFNIKIRCRQPPMLLCYTYFIDFTLIFCRLSMPLRRAFSLTGCIAVIHAGLRHSLLRFSPFFAVLRSFPFFFLLLRAPPLILLRLLIRHIIYDVDYYCRRFSPPCCAMLTRYDMLMPTQSAYSRAPPPLIRLDMLFCLHAVYVH